LPRCDVRTPSSKIQRLAESLAICRSVAEAEPWPPDFSSMMIVEIEIS
jgi:hypothetical protein